MVVLRNRITREYLIKKANKKASSLTAVAVYYLMSVRDHC